MQVLRFNLAGLEVQIRRRENWIFQKQNIRNFILANAPVFEAISRMTAPYGGNIMNRS
ncbi:hypothetical protein [Tellurirhabdus rosea]|uniref:hypothetical protein n=1 Tax=Tellurirhabdus rosea TaxID=2674997 RepID=UPI00224FC39A|nr:hypothetical protein [Tellurirhabdus rosea]